MASTTQHTNSSHISTMLNDIVCSCEKGNCTRRRERREKTFVPISNNMVPIIMLFSLSFFTCCVSAWPTILNHRRSYNYNLPQVVIPDYELDANQWAMASQPENYYELPSIPAVQDNYDDPVYEDTDETYSMPFFGPLIDPEEPEEELELEELKRQQYNVPQEKRPFNGKIPSANPAPVHQVAASTLPPSSTPAFTKSSPELKATTLPPPSTVLSGADSKKAKAPFVSGQKEIAMLRPPAAKSHHIQIDEPEEPMISVAQRSPSNEKPSAYDTLRRYLSLDDALKKESQQRRANSNRHTKRESSVSSIITDSDSLIGQLNNLKKKID